MKSIIFLFVLCSLSFSITWESLHDPVLRDVKKGFRIIQLLDEYDGMPEELSRPRMVIAESDAQEPVIQKVKDDVIWIYFFGHKIRVHNEGAAIMTFSFQHCIKVLTGKKDAPYISYFFSCTDDDDNGDKILVWFSMRRNSTNGGQMVSVMRAEDLNDWMAFEVR